MLAALLLTTASLSVPATNEVHRFTLGGSGVAPPAVDAIGNGTCGPTKVGPDCNTAPKGSFPGYKTLDACVAKLKTCKMATYASWSLG